MLSLPLRDFQLLSMSLSKMFPFILIESIIIINNLFNIDNNKITVRVHR